MTPWEELQLAIKQATEKISKDGEATDHHPNGQPRFCYPMKNGKFHGVCAVWNENGQITSEKPYSNGKLHGIAREWREDGTLQSEDTYANGVLDGPSYYFRDGKIREKWHYQAGRPHGISQIIAPDGKKVETENRFVRGALIPRSIRARQETGNLSVGAILKIRNSTVRGVCLQEYGYERFLAEVPHRIIDQQGEEMLLRIQWRKGEALCLVKVKCPSTGAFYTIRVPPAMKTVKEAVAWTFGLSAEKYAPVKET